MLSTTAATIFLSGKAATHIPRSTYLIAASLELEKALGAKATTVDIGVSGNIGCHIEALVIRILCLYRVLYRCPYFFLTPPRPAFHSAFP